MNTKPKSGLTEPGPTLWPMACQGTPVGSYLVPPLTNLRNRLLAETRGKEDDEAWARLLHQVSLEAEAQAWLTSAPLLTFPMLFEEKVQAARRYLARQRQLRLELVGTQ